MATSINDVDIFEPKKDLLDRGVEAYDENVPLLAKLGIGFTPQGLAIDGAELVKYGRDAFRDFGSGNYKEGAMNLGLAGLSGVGFIPFAGDLVKAGGKEFLKRSPQKFIDMKAKKLVPTKGNPVFEGPVRDNSPRIEKALDKQMNKHQQNFTSPEELFDTARNTAKPFLKEIDDVARNLNLKTTGSAGEAVTDKKLLPFYDKATHTDIRTGSAPGTVKTLDSIERKMIDKYDGDFTQITDPIRTRIVANTTQEADEVAKEIASRYPTKDSGNQVNGFGYRDRKLNIQYTGPNGEKIIAEIGVVPQGMADASVITHEPYEAWRVLTAKYKNVKEIPTEALEQIDELKKIQMDVFETFKPSLDPSWVSEEIIKKFAKGGAVSYERY